MAQCWEVGRVKETLFSQWEGEERRRGRRGMTCRTQCYNKCYSTRMISYDVPCSVIYTREICDCFFWDLYHRSRTSGHPMFQLKFPRSLNLFFDKLKSFGGGEKDKTKLPE